MGMFSWMATDTGRSIAATGSSRDTFEVTMRDNQGNSWTESEYEGYGEFGGKDYFELLAEMNGLTTREEGIDLAYNDDTSEVLFLTLNEAAEIEWNGVEPDSCPEQGFFYDDGEDDDYYDDDYDENY